MDKYQVVVIGGGPAGLSAAISAHKNGAKVLLIEREGVLGGILKQCIHDGFGLIHFGTRLTGPEYAGRFIDEFESLGIDKLLLAFVTKIEKSKKGYKLYIVTRDGIKEVQTDTLIFACGCRERTSKQVSIHGTRPAGIFNAGTAQYFTNILGEKVTKKCVILGSGDIGLIMARRLTLEGAKVLGVYEVKNTPSGLSRNIQQCLLDFDIPLHLSTTVTKVFGDDRLEAIEISKVDDKMNPIPGTQDVIECDALILSVGLIPENELSESLGIKMDNATKGPIVDAQCMTSINGIYSCGNCLHVNDLVDYVSESGETAGKNAAQYKNNETKYVDVKHNDKFGYLLPQKININADNSKVAFFFRSKEVLENVRLRVLVNDKEILSKRYLFVRPPEMERIELDLKELDTNSKIEFRLE